MNNLWNKAVNFLSELLYDECAKEFTMWGCLLIIAMIVLWSVFVDVDPSDPGTIYEWV